MGAYMKLEDLKGIIDFSFDFMDKEVSGLFYIELEDIKSKYAKQIEVDIIQRDYVICNFTDFINKNKTSVRKYIEENYIECELKETLIEQLCETEDILDDGGEALYYFFQNDIADFLTE